MEHDSELKAMSSLTQALDGLEPEVTARVLRWANERYGISLPPRGKGAAAGVGGGTDPGNVDFPDIASLMDAATPANGPDRALTAGYWFQVVKGEADFTGQAVNDELKHLGTGLPNVTESFNSLMKRRPALAMQVQKSGKTKQARKRYRLTEAGTRRVRALIAGTAAEPEL
jgi:hypothetical protein